MDYRPVLDRMTPYLEQKREEDHSPGIAVAFTDKQSLIAVMTSGYADLEAKVELTPDHLFEIGSISKSFTSIALQQQVEQGLLDLHKPVQDYLPIFQVQSEFDPITAHHLLSHTAAITTGVDLRTDGRYEVWALRNTQASAPPGTYYHYSNVGYRLLGLLLEKISGQSYSESIQTGIFDPLGMTNSFPIIRHSIRDRLAQAYIDRDDDRPYPPNRPLVRAPWIEAFTGDGSIASTPADLAGYLRMLLNCGISSGGQILAPDRFNSMIQPVIEAENPGTYYGYGLRITQRNGHLVISHTGGMIGYVSVILGDLVEGLGVVVLINGPGDPMEIAEFGLDLLINGYHHQPLADLPVIKKHNEAYNAGDYAGRYYYGGEKFIITAEDGHVFLATQDFRTALEPRGGDCFYIDVDGFRDYLLRFSREGKEVVTASMGPKVLSKHGHQEKQPLPIKPGWLAYPGHYRSHNPWFPSVRVVLRKDELVLIYPDGDEETLTEICESSFRIGKDPRSPERIAFDSIEDGQCLHLNIHGGDFYRTMS